MYQIPYHYRTASTEKWKGLDRKMSIFNQMIRGGEGQCATYPGESGLQNSLAKPRTFKETIQDQIAYHQRKIDELQGVKNSLTPEVEAFVEALQKLG